MYNLNKNSLILDPFNGSGTATLTAAENDIPSIGLEVNPFTSFVANVKTHNTNQEKLSELFEITLEKIEKGKVSKLERYSTFTEN